jgi:osmotically inducible protein OsmC
MATRTARTAWNGGLEDGSGSVELTSSKVGSFDVSWPRERARTPPV